MWGPASALHCLWPQAFRSLHEARNHLRFIQLLHHKPASKIRLLPTPLLITIFEPWWRKLQIPNKKTNSEKHTQWATPELPSSIFCNFLYHSTCVGPLYTREHLKGCKLEEGSCWQGGSVTLVHSSPLYTWRPDLFTKLIMLRWRLHGFHVEW